MGDTDGAPGSNVTNVRVAVRCRPLNGREKGLNEPVCVRLTGDQVIITNPVPGGEEHSFAFDVVFDQNSLQTSVWEKVGIPILDSAFSGYNGTIFAYGQTGSGKTWSMQGADGDLAGIIPRMNNTLFERILVEKRSCATVQFLVTASYFEIYNEVIYDLLDPSDRKKKERSGLEIKEHPVLGVYVKGLQEIVIDSPQKMQGLIDQGMGSRTTASTQMNADSSRSHSVFTIKVHRKDIADETKNVFAKVNLVDLAGSERVKSTGATGSTLKEGANINKSLSALGNVINALVEASKGKKGTFIPYRNSKLTRVLQESLGGNSITAMLAAMSPAACNFDETVSTLKYADRAKSIKVKAVKNEEASQISKLNDEIRLLKERLMREEGGGGGGGGSAVQVDTTALEEKHKQQLAELEEAMKNTWEEKARVSADHEKERRRLQKEQDQAVRESRKQKERAWKLLEDKSDLELAMIHVRDIARRDSNILAFITQWQLNLKEISRLEQQLGEQDTVVDIYRSSVHKDTDVLIKGGGGGGGNSGGGIQRAFSGVSHAATPRSAATHIHMDKTTLSLWKQLKDKFGATQTEVQKWAQMQDELSNKVNLFLATIQGAEDQWTARESAGVDKDDTMRGFQLIVKLLQNKKEKIHTDISKTRTDLMTISRTADDILASLHIYDTAVKEEVKVITTEDLAIDGGSSSSATVILAIVTATTELKDFINKNLKGDGTTSTSPRGGASKAPDEILPPSTYQLAPIPGGRPSSSSGTGTGTVRSSSAAVTAALGGKDFWSCEVSAANKSESSGLQITLKNPKQVNSISLQGATLSPITATSTSSSTSNNITLPSGLSLSTCSGDCEVTKTALADVIDWVALIKKNDPLKFLKRPPVKFLFDLIKSVGEAAPGLYPASLSTVKWDSIGESKTGKGDFMTEVLSFVSTYLGVPAATTSTAIITGTDADLTNTFLQHLAIAAYKHKNPGLSPSTAKTASAPSAALPSPRAAAPTWITSVRISWSTDGTSFESIEVQISPKGVDDIQLIQLPTSTSTPPVAVKVIRIQPLSWSGPSPAIRFALHGPNTGEHSSPAVRTELLVGLLNMLRQASTSLVNALEFLIRVEDARKMKAQDDVRKRMDRLATEKHALEQTLATEKQALTDEKQSLAEKLEATSKQLGEMEGLFKKEQAMREQLETLHQQLERDKSDLQYTLQEQIDENAANKSELLKLQSNHIKNEMLIETLKKQLEEQEETVTQLRIEVEEQLTRQQHLEAEKEDLSSQVMILTEERDVARSNEEDLDQKLNEKTEEFELLQESYVSTTDRCNLLQDDLLDLGEKIEDYKNALNQKDSLQKIAVSVRQSLASMADNSPGNSPNVNSSIPSFSSTLPMTSTTSSSMESTVKMVHDKNSNGNENKFHSSPLTTTSSSVSKTATIPPPIQSANSPRSTTTSIISPRSSVRPADKTTAPSIPSKGNTALVDSSSKIKPVPPPTTTSSTSSSAKGSNTATKVASTEDQDNYDDDFDEFQE